MTSLMLPSRQPSTMCNLRRQSGIEKLSVAPGFYSRDESDWIYRCLLQQQKWPLNFYEVAGRRFELPRLQTWHADDGIVYSYSNNLLRTLPWTDLLLSIRRRVEDFVGHEFNAVLVNYYRNGDDYVGWHSDDEMEMGREPVIASLSLGQARPFQVRPAGSKLSDAVPDTESVLLESGDLLLMEAGFQQLWDHRVPPQTETLEGRINLTFRHVLPPQT